MTMTSAKSRIAVCLISGGIDSTTCLYHAYQATPAYDALYGVSINYGQRHFKEVAFAKANCRRMGIPHKVIDLSGIVPKTMLTDQDHEVPNISYSEIEGVSPTYVPFRNGLMLSAVTAYTVGILEQPAAKGIDEADIYFGAHAEDAANWAYPDCTPEFIGSMANAIYVGTYHKVRLCTPLEWMNKREIIEHGSRLGVKWEETWSCYKGLEKQCGVCPTCRSRRQGFIDARVPDPTEYSNYATYDLDPASTPAQAVS